MYFISAAKALVAAAVFSAVTAHNIVLPAHGRECFHESLHKDDTMTVTFQVGDREFGSAGNLDIDFWVCVLKRIRVVVRMLTWTDHQPHWTIRDKREEYLQR